MHLYVIFPPHLTFQVDAFQEVNR